MLAGVLEVGPAKLVEFEGLFPMIMALARSGGLLIYLNKYFIALQE